MNISLSDVATQLGVAKQLSAILTLQGGSSLLAAFNTDGVAGNNKVVNTTGPTNITVSLTMANPTGTLSLFRPAGQGGTVTRLACLSQVASTAQAQVTVVVNSGAPPGISPGWQSMSSLNTLFESSNVSGPTNFNFTVSVRASPTSTAYTVMSGNVTKA